MLLQSRIHDRMIKQKPRKDRPIFSETGLLSASWEIQKCKKYKDSLKITY